MLALIIIFLLLFGIVLLFSGLKNSSLPSIFSGILAICIGITLIMHGISERKKDTNKQPQNQTNIIFSETFESLRISKNILDQQVLLVLSNDTKEDIENIKIQTELFTLKLPVLPAKKFITIKEWSQSYDYEKTYRQIEKIKVTIGNKNKEFDLTKHYKSLN